MEDRIMKKVHHIRELIEFGCADNPQRKKDMLIRYAEIISKASSPEILEATCNSIIEEVERSMTNGKDFIQ